MPPPIFSIVIPAYNQAAYLPETIQSVLKQTLGDFEIIVVNDASPDNTTEVVRRMSDPRIKLLIHEKNKGLPVTRNTGMRAALGRYIALLDSDDLFHPQKLEIHAAFLDQHQEIGVTYNPRFELNYSDTTIRELVRPPLTVGLRDFIFGYPFTPSDMVIRKSLTESVGCFNERYIAGGEDMEYPSTLALAGCQFASVDRALNYRRHHSNRYRKNLHERVKDVQDALAQIYADPRCPEEIRQLGETPLSEHYMSLIYHAFVQNRTEDGLRILDKLVQVNPSVLQGSPSQVTEYFANNSAADEKDDHAKILGVIFAQLPALPVDLTGQLDWAIQRGCLIKGTRAALWEREPAAQRHFQEATRRHARCSARYLRTVAQQVINYEIEMGGAAAQEALKRLLPHIQPLSNPADYHHFLGELSAKRAFENYERRQYQMVPGNVLQAIRNEPRFMFNRGMLSIFTRSLLQKQEE